jgi:hypothetical protein
VSEIEMTDHDAPVWNAAIEKAIERLSGRHLFGLAVRGVIVHELRGLIRPELSAAEMDAAGERLAKAIRSAHQAQAALSRAPAVASVAVTDLRALEAKWRAERNALAKSDDPTDRSNGRAIYRCADELARLIGEEKKDNG